MVDIDPTLERILTHVDSADVPPVPAYDASRALPTVPVDRRHYGFEPEV
jgi:hypothetical protein